MQPSLLASLTRRAFSVLELSASSVVFVRTPASCPSLGIQGIG
jgi:hypothetical protein